MELENLLFRGLQSVKDVVKDDVLLDYNDKSFKVDPMQVREYMAQFVKSDTRNQMQSFLTKIALPVVVMFFTLSYGSTPLLIKIVTTLLVILHVVVITINRNDN